MLLGAGNKTKFSNTDGDGFYDLLRLNYDAKSVNSVLIENDVDETLIDEFLQSNYENNDYTCDVVTYISGFIEKRLITNTKCKECYDELKNDCIRITSPLIEVKDLGGLHRPTSEVDYVIQECQRLFSYYKEERNIFTKKNVLGVLVNNLTSSILEKRPNVLKSLDTHAVGEDSHRLDTIKTIAQLFFSMRCKFFAKQKKLELGVKKCRRVLTKLVHFSGD